MGRLGPSHKITQAEQHFQTFGFADRLDLNETILGEVDGARNICDRDRDASPVCVQRKLALKQSGASLVDRDKGQGERDRLGRKGGTLDHKRVEFAGRFLS